MSTTNNGQAPGLVTPENDEGIVTGQGNNPQNNTNNSDNFRSKLIADCARLTGAIGSIYIDRGIGADSILLTVLMAVYQRIKTNLQALQGALALEVTGHH